MYGMRCVADTTVSRWRSGGRRQVALQLRLRLLWGCWLLPLTLLTLKMRLPELLLLLKLPRKRCVAVIIL